MLWVRAQSPWGHHRDVRFYSYWGRKPQEGFKKRGDKIWFVMLKNDCSSCFAELQTVELLGSKVTADGDCSHEIKRHLLFGRKAMTKLDSIIKSRDVTLLTKVHIAKPMVFPVVMYGCESWTIKKAESQRIDAFELWCWRRLPRVPRIARRSNQSILKEINP